MKIRARLMFPVTIVIVVLASTVLGALSQVITNSLTTYFQSQIITKARAVDDELGYRKERLERYLGWLESSPRLVEAVESNDRQRVYEIGLGLMEALDTEFLVLTDADGNVLLRAHSPEKYGDSISNQVTIQAALAGRALVGIEEGAVVRLSIRGATGIKNSQGELIGAVSTGYVLSSPQFVDYIQAVFDVHSTIFAGDTRITTTIRNSQGDRIVGTQLGSPTIENQVLGRGTTFYGPSNIQDVPYRSAYMPLNNIQGQTVGMVFIGLEASIIQNLIDQVLVVIVIIVLVLLFLSLVFLNAFLARQIVYPLRKLSNLVGLVAQGKLGITIEQHLVERSDELGEVSRSLEHMLKTLGAIVRAIQESALSVDQSSIQVKDVSLEISDGSSRQASAAEQISASMEEMNGTFINSAENAQKTSRLANESSKKVLVGQETLGAAADALHTISEKIGVIGEIARQTNLLALNAAIEAARAGESGRGFSVVATEVRKLAERSKEAAEEIESTAITSRGVAGQAKQIIADIVPSIQKTSDLVGEIAIATREQQQGSSQISQSIQDLDKVVQQNAAASEELNGMANVLAHEAQTLLEQLTYFDLGITSLEVHR
ncbi:MAG: HAMP domain-containing protein [Spirochaetales bacterium]|nr:HAMP domain-containing protein [Spirochaetales bacterium]